MNAVKIGMTIEEAAECTGIGRNTMRKLVDWGKLPVLKVGRKTIIRRDTLERFMTVNQGRNLLNQNDVRRVDRPFLKPSAFESEIHPSHKSVDLYSGYFAPAGSYRINACRKSLPLLIRRCSVSKAAETAATVKTVAK